MSVVTDALRFRQVHLDFHTSPLIAGIGHDFSRAQFQDMLQLGCVNSVTLFALCHHGYSYHPTKVNVMHPQLQFDLLGEQLQACREIDVLCNIYVSVGWNERWAELHPEQVIAAPADHDQDPGQVAWRRLGFYDEYLQFLCDYLDELLDNYEFEGLWLDIIGPAAGLSALDHEAMRAAQLNPESALERKRYALREQKKYLRRITRQVHDRDPALRLFHNGGHILKGWRGFENYISHFELESLPTGGYGYDHFPLSAKYVATLGDKEFLGMTGKFHTTWGEFGGFKHPNALRYECATMLAFGARCSIGDQLHPRGAMNRDTYKRIGKAYAEVQLKEQYCQGARPVSDIAMLAVESLESVRPDSAWMWQFGKRHFPGDDGLCRMLLEKQIMFDVIDTHADYSNYRVIIIPDRGRLTAEQAGKLQAWLDDGGKLVLSHESGLALHEDRFYFNLGEVAGRSEYDPEFIRLREVLTAADTDEVLVAAPVVIPGKSVQVSAADPTVLADCYYPYFNRTREHFCSHQHAPWETQSSYPAAFINANGNILYFSQALFSAFAKGGQSLYRDMFYCALKHFFEPPVRTSMPSCGRAGLMHQAHEARYVFHLVYGHRIKRGSQAYDDSMPLEVIEDNVPIYAVDCVVRVAKAPRKVRLALSGETIGFDASYVPELAAHRVSFCVPKVDLHEIVLLEY
ncbi:MAG: beta-galactosidase trimerization domain-containing protein [Gammaproteobacteria bacterium]|nr:beta-galactosidase trimerization domain-containing protein [Gammaproteobacteria bacterium]